jgi:DNA-binding transcriptional LysR family regulator
VHAIHVKKYVKHEGFVENTNSLNLILNGKIMNLKYLAQFLELSKYKNMSQYAVEAKVTHAQVSRMVSELEKELNCPLLIRSRSRSDIALTRQGKTLVKRIPFVFNELEHMEKSIHMDESLERGVFDIYTTHYLLDYFIAPKLAEFKNKCPDITLNFFGREDSPTIEERKTLLCISPFIEGGQSIQQTHLGDFHIGLWANSTYLDRYGRPKNISDLSRHTILCFERNWGASHYPTINWYMNNSGLSLNPENVIIIKSSVGIMRAASKSLGIFSLSEEGTRDLGFKFERVLPDLEGPTVKICFSYPDSWKEHASLKKINEFLKSVFTEKLKSLQK